MKWVYLITSHDIEKGCIIVTFKRKILGNKDDDFCFKSDCASQKQAEVSLASSLHDFINWRRKQGVRLVRSFNYAVCIACASLKILEQTCRSYQF